MSEHWSQGPFNIADLPDFFPRKLKPWLFVMIVTVIQLSGGVYMAAASQMIGTTGIMENDVLMAGYASLVGLAVNFVVMFRMKFRFSNRIMLLSSCAVLIVAQIICAHTESVVVLTLTCLVAGWFRMQGTFTVMSTIQLWITPHRDMSVFFCVIGFMSNAAIQLSGIACVYVADYLPWDSMQWIMVSALAAVMLFVLIFVRAVRSPFPYIPLVGIDWLGAFLWALFMLCFAFICVYGNYYDWWDAGEIRAATMVGIAALAVNLWRGTFLRHPYISFLAMTRRNVIRLLAVYALFHVLLGTEHVVEHAVTGGMLHYDELYTIDLNWFVLAGITAGSIFTYITFARRKWRYKSMVVIAFGLVACYLAYFYFLVDYGIEKADLFLPLFMRSFASTILSIVLLTSLTQSGVPFQVFPQLLMFNGFGGAVMGATFGPAVIGEVFNRLVTKNMALLSTGLTDTANIPLQKIIGTLQQQAVAVSMKEIYGWLLMIALASVAVFLIIGRPIRPDSFQPTWTRIRRMMQHQATTAEKDLNQAKST